jgi:predicted enzyme related to lactoylglutathione lyase
LENKTVSVTWIDLTIPNAEEARDFYSRLVGWNSEPVSMGDYSDFNMKSPQDDKTVTGICHACGNNAQIPPQWMIYITVSDVYESAKICQNSGGKVLTGPKKMGHFGD